jgi:hypothetical protein
MTNLHSSQIRCIVFAALERRSAQYDEVEELTDERVDLCILLDLLVKALNVFCEGFEVFW